MEFEFVVEMNLVQIGTNEFFPQLIRLAANERQLQFRPYSNQKLGRRDQSAASSELFLSFTRRSFPTGTRDGGRREPCEPQPCSLGERNVCRDLGWECRGTFRNPRSEAQMRALPRQNVVHLQNE